MKQKIFRRALILFVGVTLCGSLSHAQVTSNFDVDDDGWTAANGATLAITTYETSGGNPGGYFSVAPPTSGGSVNISMGWYWKAPAQFLGEHDLRFRKKLLPSYHKKGLTGSMVASKFMCLGLSTEDTFS